MAASRKTTDSVENIPPDYWISNQRKQQDQCEPIGTSALHELAAKTKSRSGDRRSQV